MSDTTVNYTLQPFYQWDTAVVVSTHDEATAGISLDSIFPLREMPVVKYRSSMFRSHSLQPSHVDLQNRPEPMEPWIFGLVVLLTALLGIYYRSRGIKMKLLLHSLVNRHALDRLIYEGGLSRRIALVPMGMMLCGAVSLMVYIYAMQHIGFIGFLLLLVTLMVAYLLRNAICRMLGNIFDNRNAVEAYITSNYLYHLVLATLLAGILYPLAWLPEGRDAMSVVVVVLVGLVFLMRFVRGMKIFFVESMGARLYLFYYLCIVELIPVLALMRWFIVQ